MWPWELQENRTMDKIDPGPGYRLLGVGEIKPEGYEVHQPHGGWDLGEQIGSVIREGQRAMRIKLPTVAPKPLDEMLQTVSGASGISVQDLTAPIPTVAPAPGSPEDLASLAELDALIPPVAKILDNVVLDTHFLQWVADRLVHVHGDPETVDFVLRLRALAEMFPELPKPFTPNKYTRLLLTLDGRKVPVDVYSVLAAFPVGNSAVDHALKKLLAPGQRGQKDRLQDLKEARASLDRAIQMEGG